MVGRAHWWKADLGGGPRACSSLWESSPRAASGFMLLRPAVATWVSSQREGLGCTRYALPKRLGISPGARKITQLSNRLEDNFVFPSSEIIKISLCACLQTRGRQ